MASRTWSARTSERPGSLPQAGRPLLCLVHVTDLQLADVQSPTRFEFLNRHFTDPRYAKIVPVQRPQEALTVHAVDALQARGFWEVTTCSIVDWPCQARLIELTDSGGYLSIVCTMVDHDAPVTPRSLETIDDLAALHRELAANVPYGGAGSGLSGAAADRNVELRMVPPFPLERGAARLARRGACPNSTATGAAAGREGR